jgi:hypothetical protein
MTQKHIQPAADCESMQIVCWREREPCVSEQKAESAEHFKGEINVMRATPAN